MNLVVTHPIAPDVSTDRCDAPTVPSPAELASERPLQPLQLLSYLPYQIGLLSGRFRAALSRRALDERDLSVPDWRVLVLIGEVGYPSARDVVANSDMDHVTVHRAVMRLMAKGLLHRVADPGNRRLKLLQLTRAGADLLDQVSPIARQLQDQMLDALTEEEAAVFRAAMEKLLKRFPRPSEPTSQSSAGAAAVDSDGLQAPLRSTGAAPARRSVSSARRAARRRRQLG
jgi:DNA-binding MarR family transcriptional regulator